MVSICINCMSQKNISKICGPVFFWHNSRWCLLQLFVEAPMSQHVLKHPDADGVGMVLRNVAKKGRHETCLILDNTKNRIFSWVARIRSSKLEPIEFLNYSSLLSKDLYSDPTRYQWSTVTVQYPPESSSQQIKSACRTKSCFTTKDIKSSLIYSSKKKTTP